jgi:hypothetical protein
MFGFSVGHSTKPIPVRRRLAGMGGMGVRRRRGCLPHLELLEGRVTPSTLQWSGLGGDHDWSNPVNWLGDVAPQNGDNLDFPTVTTTFQATNDFAAGMTFGSIKIDSPSYTLTGNSVNLTGGIVATYSMGSSTDSIATNLGGGTVSMTPGGSLTLGGVISGIAGLSVSGGGTVVVQASNTFTGTTTINDSGTTMLVDGTVGAVQVNAGAVLGGTGTVGDVTSTGGTISPGDGPGILNTGALTLDSNSVFADAVDGNTPGSGTTSYGQVVANGRVNLGNATLTLTIGGGYAPATGDQLVIIKNDSGSAVTGQFAGLNVGVGFLEHGDRFRITYTGGTSQDDVDLLGPLASTVAVTAPPSATYGQTVTFMASVTPEMSGTPGTPTGMVSFFDGNPASGGTELGTAPLNAQGDAMFPTTSLPVTGSPHSIYAMYDPDSSSSFAGSTSAQPAPVTIDPAPLTVMANDTSKVYGAPLPTFTISYTGFQNNDTAASLTTPPTATTTATQFSPVTMSGYPITPQGAVDPNYTFTYVPGTLTVTTVPLTVTGVTANNKVYDTTTTATLNTSSAGLSGVLNGDDVTLVTTGYTASFATKNAGTAISVTVSGMTLSGTAAGNYTLTQPTGLTANITQAPLSVTGVTANNKVYDGTTSATLNTSSASLSGVLDSDSVSLASSGASGTFADPNAGNAKPVTVSGFSLSGADAGNYSLTQPTGLTANITPAPLTVTAANQSMNYGGPIPSLTFSTSGLVAGDTASSVLSGSLATTATTSSPVGQYAITQGTLTSNNNYTLSVTPGMLTVNQAPLVISANNASKVFGAPLPSFTASYSGFVNGETAAVLTMLPILEAVDTGTTTPVASTSPAGNYTILVGGASATNYSISYQSGMLNIAQAATTTTLTASSNATLFGQLTTLTATVTPVSPGAGNPTGTVDLVVNGNAIRAAALDPTTGMATFNTVGIPFGILSVSAVYAGDSNFQGSQVTINVPQVSLPGTQTVVTVKPVRNPRGQLLAIDLKTQVLVVSPGTGVPSGTVVYFLNGRAFKTRSLSNGVAVLSVRPARALGQFLYVTYTGSSGFQASVSASQVITARRPRTRVVSVAAAKGEKTVRVEAQVPAQRPFSRLSTMLRPGHRKQS